MGFDLGLGMVGANAFFDQQRKLEQYDVDKTKRASELALLPEKEASERSAYALKSKQNTANLGLVNAQTENSQKALEVQKSQLEAQQLRQPLEQAAAFNGVEINKLLSDFQLNDLPRAISEKKRAGVFSEADASVATTGKVAQLIVNQTNPQEIVSFLNAINETKHPQKRTPSIATFSAATNEKTGEKMFVSKDAQGNVVHQVSMATIQAVQNALNKPEFKTVNAGDSLVQIHGGQATPVYTAPESLRSLAAKQGPLERDVEYLVNQHGMSKELALSHLNSAKTMTREQFILKSVQDSIAMGKTPTDKEMANFGALYDSTKQATQPASPASNTAVPANLNPQIKSLLDIP